MENNLQGDTQYDDEIDLQELFGVLWAGSKKIISITAISAVISVFYALSIPSQYQATVLLAPAQSDSSDLSGAIGQFGGLASLAGVSIGGGQSNESQIAQKVMKSRSFIENFIVDNDLAVEIAAVQSWDETSGELQYNDDAYDVKNKQWLDKKGNFAAGPPKRWNLYRAFDQRLSISEDKKLGLVTVAIEYYSPDLAKKWLDLYIAAINAHMQQRQIEKVSNNINYLELQIEKTSVTEMREIFYNIIEEQTKQKMVAEASPEYAFVVVSPSMVPELRSKPRRTLICIIGTSFGAILSVLLVLFRHYTRKTA